MSLFTESVRQRMALASKIAALFATVAFATYRVRFSPVVVESHVAAFGSVAVEVMGTGTLEARVSATISPKISGLVKRVLVDQGDRIVGGQLLVELHDEELRQQVEIARADLDALKAGVARAVADVTIAEATVTYATATHARNEKLLAKGGVSNDDVERLAQQRSIADAQLKRSQAAKVEIERQILRAEATLRYSGERLSDTKIVSPFDGLVVRRSREAGDIVVPGTDILQIISTKQIWVSA